jgi:hypothetical protein
MAAPRATSMAAAGGTWGCRLTSLQGLLEAQAAMGGRSREGQHPSCMLQRQVAVGGVLRTAAGEGLACRPAIRRMRNPTLSACCNDTLWCGGAHRKALQHSPSSIFYSYPITTAAEAMLACIPWVNFAIPAKFFFLRISGSFQLVFPCCFLCSFWTCRPVSTYTYAHLHPNS